MVSQQNPQATHQKDFGDTALWLYTKGYSASDAAEQMFSGEKPKGNPMPANTARGTSHVA